MIDFMKNGIIVHVYEKRTRELETYYDILFNIVENKGYSKSKKFHFVYELGILIKEDMSRLAMETKFETLNEVIKIYKDFETYKKELIMLYEGDPKCFLKIKKELLKE